MSQVLQVLCCESQGLVFGPYHLPEGRFHPESVRRLHLSTQKCFQVWAEPMVVVALAVAHIGKCLVRT